MLKKFVFLALVLVSLSAPSVALASQVPDEQIICPQPYGGGVVCGVRTGIADNLPLFGALALGVSGTLLYFSKKINKSEL